MSQKITGKNLSYNATLPPFLARLRGEAASNSDGPDPIIAARRRPTGRPRSNSEEAEDEPLVVDEAGNVVGGVRVRQDGTVTDDAALAGERYSEGVSNVVGTNGAGANRASREEPKDAEKSAGIGAVKKRKVGKVIGAGQDEDEGRQDPRPEQEERSVAAKSKAVEFPTDKTTPLVKTKRKAKKIKLSFGDEEG
ncbi:hypothetical protein VTK73DRAFT_3996 [Phialemonium thermophilum]|uniref:DUF4604 domain-containing protein n=1 Tax=Phialemonium thermophilum TaxID=223376 RepID=A0ABR3WWN7_9PEZI